MQLEHSAWRPVEMPREQWSIADQAAGYQIGSLGLMPIAESRAFLGIVSEDTLEGLFNAGSIRKT